MASVSRRDFLRAGAVTGGAILGFEGLLARSVQAAWTPRPDLGYGAIAPVLSENTGEAILALPEGFKYTVLGKTGAAMADGTPTPAWHDGMAAFQFGPDIRLIRNHELRGTPNAPNGIPVTVGAGKPAYDPAAKGGTTTLVVDPVTRLLKSDFVSLAGTHTNCAGGLTPWRTWISSEEVVGGINNGWGRNHGYNFEVPVTANGPVDPVPLKSMGRFVHEAVAVDPATGIVYQTEDANPSGFFRFIPYRYGDLSSGRLQALAIHKAPNYDTRTGQKLGARMLAKWVDIATPDPDLAAGAPSVYKQAEAKGAAKFARLEGCWYGNGAIFINSTSGGDLGLGQVWVYEPHGDSHTGHLSLLFESPGETVLDAPDNICVTPKGCTILCEDGDGDQYLRGLTANGQIFDFAKNNFSTAELAGAVFSPDGRTLFVNIQGGAAAGTGMTLAIWGPWNHGPF